MTTPADWPSRHRYYGTMYADPPWKYVPWSPKGNDRCPDGPRGYYHTMEFERLAGLPVESLAARDCRLFMWTTDSHLPIALALGERWGFEYSTVAFTWAKRSRTGKWAQSDLGHVRL